ncbi:sugar dehydrogenase complex small subunit [Asaia bogorensis]|nr:sugar dehydrogenase complex small subunit [Asaia bogorensis]BAT18662.1 FAD dependent sorbitol dehydrogenase small subunit [Asaia bogorensis NBRC 16594]GBQ75475.1 membrane bound FAD containing D-sorbitol dehydrogenase [Asaia bogorensis NBRC 16594]
MGEATRRSILRCGMALVPVVALYGKARSSPLVGEAVPCPDGFHALSFTLIGHDDLDPALARQVWSGLVMRDGEFPGRYSALATALSKAGVKTWRDYQHSEARAHEMLHAVAVDIVSAWYLGRVGPMLPRAETGTPVFITYEGALMWRPTIDVTVIPTYARGGPGYWADPPPIEDRQQKDRQQQGGLPNGRPAGASVSQSNGSEF